MNIRAVVTRPDGSPMIGVKVEVLSTLDQTLLDTVKTTNQGGEITAETDGPFFVRARVTGDRHRVLVTSFGNYMNADYVVDASGMGTHTTLCGPTGALQAAIATGVSKYIWICTTHTETISAQEVLPVFAGQQQIMVASGGNIRGQISFAIAGTTPGFTLAAKPDNVARLTFKDFRINRVSGTGALFGPAAGGPSIPDLEFDGMDFKNAGSTFNALVGGSLLTAMTGNNLTVRNCTGDGLLVIHQLGATSAGLGTFVMVNNFLTLDGVNRHSSSTSVDWGMSGGGQVIRGNVLVCNAAAAIQINYDMATFTFDSNRVTHNGARTFIFTGNVQTGSNVHIVGNSYQATAGGASFLTLQSATSNIKNVIVIGNSLDGPGSGTAISTVLVNTGALPSSIVLAPNSYRDWTTNFDGTAGGATDDFTDVNLDGSAAVAPNSADFLIGTANASLSSAIVVGTTPGGELGGTWASPTVDATHSGSAHHTEAHALLSVPHSDTTAAAVAAGALLRGNAAGTAWEKLVAGTDGKVLTLSGGLPTWLAAAGGGSGGGFLTVLTDATQVEWTNQPAALTELLGLTVNRTKIDLTNAATVRLVVDVLVAGVAGAKLRAQYYDGAAWQYLDGATGPEVAIDATGTFASVTVNLAAGAKADQILRVVGISGNGTADPAFGLIGLQFDTIAGGASVAPPDAKYVTTLASSGLSAEIVRQFLGNYYADTYPGSPNAMDDEFDDTSGNSGTINGLDARWAWHDQNTSTATFPLAGYLLLTGAGASGYHWIGQNVPAGDWTFETLVSVNGGAGPCGVIVKDGTAVVHYELGVYMKDTVTNGPRILGMRLNNVYGFLATWAGEFPCPTRVYLRVHYVSATKVLTWFYSNDGIGWSACGTQTSANAITDVGLHLGSATALAYFDYFRRIA